MKKGSEKVEAMKRALNKPHVSKKERKAAGGIKAALVDKVPKHKNKAARKASKPPEQVLPEPGNDEPAAADN